MLYVGDDPDTPSLAGKNGAASALGVNLASDKWRGIVPELLLEHADTGPTRWNPLRPTFDRLEIWLGGLFWTQRLVRGGSTFTESFNKADSTTLGPDLTWTEITGNVQVKNNRLEAVYLARSGSWVRAEHDLASSDNYCQFLMQGLTTNGGANGGDYVGPAARFSSSAITCYLGRITRGDINGNGDMATYKVVAASETNLASVSIVNTTVGTYKIECVGSTIKCYESGTLRSTATDTGIASGTRAGFHHKASTPNSTSLGPKLDDFEMGDVVPPGYIKTGVTAVGWSATGAKALAREHVKTGSAASGWSAEGASTFEHPVEQTGSGASGWSASGERALELPRDGGGVEGHSASGTSERITQYVVTGAGAVGHSATGDQTLELSRSGQASEGHAASGDVELELARSGQAVEGHSASGASDVEESGARDGQGVIGHSASGSVIRERNYVKTGSGVQGSTEPGGGFAGSGPGLHYQVFERPNARREQRPEREVEVVDVPIVFPEAGSAAMGWHASGSKEVDLGIVRQIILEDEELLLILA
jgi:hypothetical protein